MTKSLVTEISIQDSNIFAGTWGGGVYLSTNNGINWNNVYSGNNSYTYIHCFVIKGSTVFAGSNDGVIYSTDNGKKWTIADSGFVSHKEVYTLTVSGNSIYAGTDDGVYISYNNGEIWSLFNSGFEFPDFGNFGTSRSIQHLVANDLMIFAVSDNNMIFRKTNYESRWSKVGLEGLPVFLIQSIAINGSTLYIGTDKGIWLCPLSELVVDVMKPKENPSSFLLENNYPNPFNPSTTIKYSIPNNSLQNRNASAIFVSLKVYDILGREVATLVNGQKSPGNYTVKFDGSKLVSGVYFYRMEAGSFSQTKKLLVLK